MATFRIAALTDDYAALPRVSTPQFHQNFLEFSVNWQPPSQTEFGDRAWQAHDIRDLAACVGDHRPIEIGNLGGSEPGPDTQPNNRSVSQRMP
ncbi:hypothetical protein [Rhizobium sp. G21]|uniref:hypothetical protein n=1 Tax=Rhizobium sp. G21 TaxID=2758439 RepID=UPI0016036329|nr:hypothetical protein [Rhizobium sp. G21]MBB1250284.1 hypothetical protein [Rhizobium sp. G21]